MVREELITQIVEEEWKAFDQTKNEGGRASCQDDFFTFNIMRRSQYMTWTVELLALYATHIVESSKVGRNLITEKYGRMMESTTPEKYAAIKDAFLPLSDERVALQEGIIQIQVSWMEAFAKEYPKMAGNARSIHTTEDNAYNTSYETYLRGEISTYSEELIIAYAGFIVDLAKEGKNLAYLTMENTAKLYGYSGIAEAEKRMFT